MTGRPTLRLNKPSRRFAKPEKAAKRSTTAELLAQLAGHYPRLFDPDGPLPLALGIHNAMHLDCGMSKTQVRRALRVWTLTLNYLSALAKGGPRYGIDGKPCGEITEQEQASAAERLAEVDADQASG